MRIRDKIIEALKDGPGTSYEIAAEIGTTPRLASAHLCLLQGEGLVEHGPERVKRVHKSAGGFIYHLVDEHAHRQQA